MDRIIEVKVRGNYVIKDNKNAGTQGEANVTALRIEFDESWDGYAKTITWWDAQGQPATNRILTADLLENMVASGRIYLVPVPGEALVEWGECMFSIDGYINGRRSRSAYTKMVVKPGKRAAVLEDVTPTQAEQLQVQIDVLMDSFQKEGGAAKTYAGEAAESATAAADNAKAAAASANSAADALAGAKAAQTGAQDAKVAAETAAANANGYTNHPPVLGENGNWMVWNGTVYEDSGKTYIGKQGATPQLQAGTVSKLSHDAMPTASITGTPEQPVLNLGLPQGEPGVTPNFQMGTVTTLPAGSEATASITGTAEKPVLNLGVPKGDEGFSPTIGVESYGSGYKFTVTKEDGTKQETILRNTDRFSACGVWDDDGEGPYVTLYVFENGSLAKNYAVNVETYEYDDSIDALGSRWTYNSLITASAENFSGSIFKVYDGSLPLRADIYLKLEDDSNYELCAVAFVPPYSSETESEPVVTQVWLIDAEGPTYQGDICSYDKLHAYGSSTSASYDDVKIGDRVICEQDGAVLTVTAKSENYAGLSFIQYYLDGYTSGGADLSALAWVPTIEYTNTGFGSLTELLDISTFNGYMGAHLEGLTYEDLNGVSEINLSMTRFGDAGHPAGGNGEKVACPVTHEDEYYFVGNKSLINSSAYEDTGEAFAIAIGKIGLTTIRVTEEWYGEYMIYGSYGKPTWNQMPEEFLPDSAKPESITVEGAAVSATVTAIVTAMETGKAVIWKNTADNGLYRVLDVYRDIMDGWHRVLLARAKANGQETGLYYLYYNSNYYDSDIGSYLRLVPLYAPGVGVRFIHGYTAATEKLFNVDSSGNATVTDVATGEVTTLATTEDVANATILTSPGGNKFQITVDDNGNLTATAVTE